MPAAYYTPTSIRTGARSRSRNRSRSRPESWQRAMSRSRSRSNCLDPDSRTFCLNLCYNSPMQGENLHALLGNTLSWHRLLNSGGIYIHLLTGGGEPYDLQRGIQRGQTWSCRQSARKWHKIDILIDIRKETKQLLFIKRSLLLVRP